MEEAKLIEILRIMKDDLSQRKSERKDKRTLWLDGMFDVVAAIHELLEYNSLYIASNLFDEKTIEKIRNIIEGEEI